ncbi:hypothetical protein SAMN05421787_11245 [Virgibacillus pantothenticus]|nr:hypothetical protein SAMN05421787_11245 [Virgibacillus pantothenticus]
MALIKEAFMSVSVDRGILLMRGEVALVLGEMY